MTFDSDHGGEHLVAAGPQTPVRRLRRVLRGETGRQLSPLGALSFRPATRSNGRLTLRFRAAGSSKSTCSISMSRPSSGGVAGLTAGSGLPAPWPTLQYPLLPPSESSLPPQSIGGTAGEKTTVLSFWFTTSSRFLWLLCCFVVVAALEYDEIGGGLVVASFIVYCGFLLVVLVGC